LEGLIVRRYCSAEDGFGLEFSHRDGIYPEKRIYLRDEALQREWMKLLHFYRGDTVQQKYEIGAKIGTGKFSVVYRCRNRTEDHSYALKEIATFKLDP
jgi:serine/threonine protein kinase